MNQTNEFCQTTQQNSFPLSISSFVIILLHLLSAFILKLRGVGRQSSPKTKSKSSNELKSKDHVRWFIYQMKRMVLLILNGL